MSYMRIFSFILLLSIRLKTILTCQFTKHFVNNSYALCLDGTKPTFYIHKASFSNKWMIFFEGSGWCSTTKECFTRQQTLYGSSLRHGQCVPDFHYSQYMPKESKLNTVYVRSCDGGSFAGNATSEFEVLS